MEGSRYFASPCLYKENGFKEKEKAQELIDHLRGEDDRLICKILSIEKKKEKKKEKMYEMDVPA